MHHISPEQQTPGAFKLQIPKLGPRRVRINQAPRFKYSLSARILVPGHAGI